MDEKEVTVSTGVRFRLRPPSNYAILARQRTFAAQEPKPPTVFIEAKSRDEENPNDPTYLTNLRLHTAAATEALYDVMLCTGSEIAEIPETMMGVESEEFAELLAALQIPRGHNPMERYLQWVKIVATPSPGDWRCLMGPLLRLLGEAEEDVAEAVAFFPGDEERDADNGTRPERRRKNRDKIRSPATGAGP